MCREYATSMSCHIVRQNGINIIEDVKFSKNDAKKVRVKANPNPYWFFNGKKIVKKPL